MNEGDGSEGRRVGVSEGRRVGGSEAGSVAVYLLLRSHVVLYILDGCLCEVCAGVFVLAGLDHLLVADQPLLDGLIFEAAWRDR